MDDRSCMHRDLFERLCIWIIVMRLKVLLITNYIIREILVEAILYVHAKRI